MPLTAEAQQQIHAEDLRTWADARALDASAEELLTAALGPDQLRLKLQDFTAQSRFLRRQALVKIAGDKRARAALAVFRHADTIWWSFVARHERLIRSMAKRYARQSPATAPDLEDLYSVLAEATIRAAVDWDPGRGRFITVWVCVARTMWQIAPERQGTVHMGTRHWRVAQCGSDAGCSADERGPQGHGALLQTATPQPNIDLSRALAKLPASDADLVLRAVVHEEPIVQIARDLGIPRLRVSAQLREAIERLRRELSTSDGSAPAEQPVLTLVAN